MTAKGNFTAFNELKPLQGSIVDDMNNLEQVGFQRRAEDRAIAKIAKDEEDKAKAKKDVLREKVVKNLNNYDTGSRSLNELQGNLLIKAMDEYIPIIETLDNPKATEQEKLRAQLKLQNLQDLPKNLKNVTDFFTEQDKAYRTGVATNKLFKDPEYEKIFQTGFENYHLDLDDNGLPIVAFTDKNKDGKIDVLDVQSYEQIKSGLPTFNFQPKYDKEDLLKEAITKIQPQVNQDVNGSLIVKTTGLDKKAVDQHVTDLMFDGNGNPSDVLKSFARENGVDYTNPAGLKSIKDDFINSINLYAKSGREESPNTQSLEREKFNYSKSQNRKKQEKEKTTYEVVATPPVYAEANVKSANGYKTVSVIGSKAIPYVEGYEGKKKLTFTNAKINSYTIVKNKLGNRQIVAEIVYEDTKGQKIKNEALDGTESTDETVGAQNKSRIVALTQKDAIKYAKQMGFESTTQMANQARVGKETSDKPKTVVQNGVTYTYNEKTGQYE